MNTRLASIGCAVVMSLLSAGSAKGASMVIKDGAIFSTGQDSLDVSFASGVSAPDACPLESRSITVLGATPTSDVVISGSNAFVKLNDASVVEVDISACLPEGAYEAEDCYATIDPVNKQINIPCATYLGNNYSISMRQRGNSMNWAASFYDENGVPFNYRNGQKKIW